MKEEDKQIQNEEYNEYVKQVTPTNNLFGNMVKAFIVGGVICVIGQVILNVAIEHRLGLDKETAGSWCSMLLILLSIILTGFNIYPTFAKWGGAGALVPITGFANSVASPAIEFKKEGQVFGIGCKIFTISRAGHPLWNFYKLGVRTHLLDWTMRGMVLKADVVRTDVLYSAVAGHHGCYTCYCGCFLSATYLTSNIIRHIILTIK